MWPYLNLIICKSSAAKPYTTLKSFCVRLLYIHRYTQYGFARRVQRTFNSNTFQTSTLLQRKVLNILIYREPRSPSHDTIHERYKLLKSSWPILYLLTYLQK